MTTSGSGEHSKVDIAEVLHSFERSIQELSTSVKNDVSFLVDNLKNVLLRVASIEGRVTALEVTKSGESLTTQREHIEHAIKKLQVALSDLERAEAESEPSGESNAE